MISGDGRPVPLPMPAGMDATRAGKQVASGTYYYVLEADGTRIARILALIAD